MSTFVIFQKDTERIDDKKLFEISKHFHMNNVCNSEFYKKYPEMRIIIQTVSENEFKIRQNMFQFSEKNDENIFFSNCYFCFYEGTDNIFQFIQKQFQKELDEYNNINHPKYTKFRDIPQFTRTGNWECDFTLPELVKFVEKEVEEQNLQLEPDFQRGHVWTEEQQIAFLEFFLRGGKTGRVIYLNNPSWTFPNEEYNEYVCVDGLQRYTAIKRFINNEIPVFGTYYKDYEDNMRSSRTMRLNINDLGSRKEVLQWYIEFNSGGTPHTENEIERVKKLLAEEIK